MTKKNIINNKREGEESLPQECKKAVLCDLNLVSALLSNERRPHAPTHIECDDEVEVRPSNVRGLTIVHRVEVEVDPVVLLWSIVSGAASLSASVDWLGMSLYLF